ncbi:hypothetical protein HKX48_009496 [Thoreauomyces humboldtii]|nr:hypothetical protein HKX48_009496 [Thoreauomyces humboldtii]
MSSGTNRSGSDEDADFHPSRSAASKAAARNRKRPRTSTAPPRSSSSSSNGLRNHSEKQPSPLQQSLQNVSSPLPASPPVSSPSCPPLDEVTKRSLDDFSLEELLQKEEELQLQIDGLSEDIRQLQGETHPTDDSTTDTPLASVPGIVEEEEEEIDYSNFDAPTWCVPIKTNVMTFEWATLAKASQFDVILMDPPWQLASHAPTRGVAIAYQQLPDACIEDLPISTLQENGFIFIWVINNKYVKAFELLERWGYDYVDDITWVKQTVNRRMAKGHGYYLQHAKETCLVGRKGMDPPGCRHAVASDVIFSQRRGQSQKPEELYEMIEKLVPNGKYLEIFGRKNNLRDYWVTVGNEL